MRRPSIIGFLAVTILVIGTAFPANAAQPKGPGDSVTLIALDQGAAPAVDDMDMAETVLSTVVDTINTGTVAFLEYGETVPEPHDAEAGSDAASEAADVAARLRETIGPRRSDQFAALTKAFSYLARVEAPAGSSVVLITSGRIAGESEATPGRLTSIGELFKAEGWTVDVATLPSTAAPLRILMSSLATSSGGAYYDLGTTAGLTDLLRTRAGIDLATTIEAELVRGFPVATTVDIAPRTESLTVVFIRDIAETDVSLFRPNGSPVTEGMASVTVVETPNTVTYRITNPVAGIWNLQGVGSRSRLVAGVDVRNPLELRLVQQPPLPVGEAGVISAAAYIGEEAQPLAGATVEARVRQPNGQAKVYILNDAGYGGDEKAVDGIFSAALPAPEMQGINDVSLELSWVDYGAVLRSEGTFQTEVFPALKVTRISDIKATEGETVNIATVQVMVGAYPHLVGLNEIRATLSGPDGEFPATLVPRSQPEIGKAWEFDVMAAPATSGDYALDVALASSYLGREYSAETPGIVAAATINPKPFTIAGLQVWMWAAILTAAVLVLALAMLLLRRARPYGFLYDDQDHVVVDFGRLRRSPLRRLFSSGHIAASEIPGLPFRGGSFRFTKNTVELRYQRASGDPSLRVNSRPAGPAVTLHDDVWLGVGGRLLTFVTRRRPHAMGSPADD